MLRREGGGGTGFRGGHEVVPKGGCGVHVLVVSVGIARAASPGRARPKEMRYKVPEGRLDRSSLCVRRHSPGRARPARRTAAGHAWWRLVVVRQEAIARGHLLSTGHSVSARSGRGRAGAEAGRAAAAGRRRRRHGRRRHGGRRTAGKAGWVMAAAHSTETSWAVEPSGMAHAPLFSSSCPIRATSLQVGTAVCGGASRSYSWCARPTGRLQAAPRVRVGDESAWRRWRCAWRRWTCKWLAAHHRP